MKSYPMVSVIITSFNQRDYLKEALDSVLAQTFGGIEIIVVDDTSTDGSQELIRSFEQKYPNTVRSLLMHQNRGVAAARNAGFASSTGVWITHLDGDDRYLPHKIERELHEVRRVGELGVAYSNYRWVNEAGTVTASWADSDDVLPAGDVLEAFFCCDFPKGSYPRYPLFHRESVEGELNRAGLPVYEDLDLMIRLAARGEFRSCGEVASEYRRHGTGLSAAKADVFYRCAAKIWKDNRHLLNRLPGARKSRCRSGFRSFVAQFATITAVQKLSSGKRLEALRWWATGVLWRRRLEHVQIPFRVFVPKARSQLPPKLET